MAHWVHYRQIPSMDQVTTAVLPYANPQQSGGMPPRWIRNATLIWAVAGLLEGAAIGTFVAVRWSGWEYRHLFTAMGLLLLPLPACVTLAALLWSRKRPSMVADRVILLC